MHTTMKKKAYISPVTEAIKIAPASIVCTSITGVTGTADLDTSLDEDDLETETEYLSREIDDDFFEEY